MSYHEAKKSASDEYQKNKLALRGSGAPFAGWLVSGDTWESFDAFGVLIVTPKASEAS